MMTTIIIDNWQAPSNAADRTLAITDYHNKEFTVVLTQQHHKDTMKRIILSIS